VAIEEYTRTSVKDKAVAAKKLEEAVLAVYCKKFVSESVKFSAGLGERKSLIDQSIEL
jgi:hypothetical protein